MKKLFFIMMLSLVGLSTYAQWEQTNGPYGGQEVECLAVSGTNIFAGTNGEGIFFSNNNGNTWTAVNNGLTNMYIRSLAVSDTNVFAGTYDGVFLSSNNGNSWTNVSNGLPSGTVVMSLVTNGTNVFAGLGSDPDTGGVYISSNNGNSWTAVNNGLPYDTMEPIYSVLGLGVNGNYIFALPMRADLAVSNNNGASWSTANNGYQNDDNSFHFTTTDSDIFVGNFYGVFISNNNGGLWTTMNNALTTSGVTALTAFGNNIFAGSSGEGVYLSTNNGGLWTNESDNLIENQTITSFAIVGESIVFAGTGSNGVWKRALSEMTGIEEINNNAGDIAVHPNPVTLICKYKQLCKLKT